jgi:hypothetical protein
MMNEGDVTARNEAVAAVVGVVTARNEAVANVTRV